MAMLKIYKLEDIQEEQAVSSLACGKHIIGRGPLLQCNDKRVSRNHAEINVTQDKATITSVHVNPCYFMAASSNNMVILPKNEPMVLNDNDRFALLTDMFWFKVKFGLDDDMECLAEVSHAVPDEDMKIALKRSADLDDESESNKKCKISNEQLDELLGDIDKILKDKTNTSLNDTKDESIPDNTLENLDRVASGSNSGEVPNESTKGESNPDNTLENHEDRVASDNNESINNDIKKENVSDEEDEKSVKKASQNDIKNEDEEKPKTNNDDPSNTSHVKKENEDCEAPPADNNQNQPSTSQPRRERCWYGDSCFRKNPIHRADFSHPGDDDFDSDSNDDRPTCSFGAACYRKNKDHRRQYKHPNRPAARPNGDQPKKKRKATTKKPKQGDESSEDDYDLEDPFIADSEDEYEASSDGEDSDWDDSQEVAEDSQETRRLVKEAKRFTKKN